MADSGRMAAHFSSSPIICAARFAWRRSWDCPVIYVFTHDGIGVGEDGPTHQPIEQTMSLRLIPHLTVIRPGDGTETA